MWSSAPKQDKHDEPMRDPAARVNMSSPSQQSYGAAQYKLPAHMDDNEKIIIQSRHGGSRHKVETVDRGSMSMFSQQMASLVGPAYVGAFGSGIFWGMTHMPESRIARTRRIMVSTYLDNVGKTATRFGNNTAAAVLLYILTGKMINFVF